MNKTFEYIETLERLLLNYTKKNKHHIKTTNQKLKNLCILLSEKGITPNEISECFDPNIRLYDQEGHLNSDDDDIEIEEEKYKDTSDIISQFKLSQEEQMVLNENPVIMIKNLKKYFNEKTSIIKGLGFVEKNKWSNEESQHHHKRQKIPK